MTNHFERHWRCYAACMVLYLSYFQVGYTVAYPSAAIPDINRGHGGFIISDLWMPWVTSVVFFFAALGSVVVVPIMERYGRKLGILLCTVPVTAGYALTVASGSVETFATGRAVSGIGMGMQFAAVPVHLAEISLKQTRGISVAGSYLALLVGMEVCYVVGTFVDFRWQAATSLFIAGFTVLLTIFLVPESPRWLIWSGQHQPAICVLTRFRNGTKEDERIKLELQEIESIVRAVGANRCRSRAANICGGMMQLLKAPLWKPFLVSQLLMLFQQFTGSTYIKTYALTIFQDAVRGFEVDVPFFDDPNYQTILIGGANIAGALLGLTVVDRLGRRPSLLAASLAVTIANVGLGAFYYIRRMNASLAEHHLFWLPAASLALYSLGFGFALGHGPVVFMSEIFPVNVRGYACGFGSLSHNLFAGLVVLVYGNLRYISNFFIFWASGVVAFAMLVFVAIWIPETKGRSLEDIQRIWYPHKDRNGSLQGHPS